MSINQRFMLKNIILALIGIVLLCVSYIPYQSSKFHIGLLFLGAIILGLSGDGILKWFGSKDEKV